VEEARRAARYFFWKRFGTKFGIAQLVSAMVLFLGALFVYRIEGDTWFIGMVGTILTLWLVTNIVPYTAFQSASAKRISSLSLPEARLAMNLDGLTISEGGNVVQLPWKRIRYLWLGADFVVLGLSYFSFIYFPTADMSTDIRSAIESRQSPAFAA
jgi:hypothetical protein